MPCPPAAVTSSAVSSIVSGRPRAAGRPRELRPVQYTIAPASPSATAIPRPAPRVAPATSAILPFNTFFGASDIGGRFRRPGTVIEKKLPLDTLDGPRASLDLRARLLSRLLARLDEREWIPGPLLARRTRQHRKNLMFPHLSKPIRCVAGIRLL